MVSPVQGYFVIVPFDPRMSDCTLMGKLALEYCVNGGILVRSLQGVDREVLYKYKTLEPSKIA